MQEGSDGARDHRGELLPELSRSATKMDYERLVNTPLPTFSKKYPGSPFFMEFGYFLLRRTVFSQFRTFEVTGQEKIPTDRGSMCAAWHTNGLLDPVTIFLTHPKKFVVGGRHDLVTRPILGFWARKFAVQPVVRKAELLRGGCSEEEANYLNGRSLLNLATGISHGFGCALFPEGTSHSESHLIRLKTGPFRTVLAAAAHAQAVGNNLPVLIPIGLHFRVRHLFRTDCWVEYGEPIAMPKESLPEELVQTVKQGNWMEPPAEVVTDLRDKLESKLRPLTPDRETFAQLRRDSVISHVKNNISSNKQLTWREEVLKIRELNDNQETDEVNEVASQIGEKLHNARLDGRDINQRCDGLRGFSIPITFVNSIKLIFMITLLPLTVLSLGWQIAMGRFLGDKTDEGLDARTSYHMLFGMFGSLLWWPIVSTVTAIVYVIFEPDIGYDFLSIIGSGLGSIILGGAVIWILSIILLWVSAVSFVYGWDAVSDFARWTRRMKTNSEVSQDLVKLRELLN